LLDERHPGFGVPLVVRARGWTDDDEGLTMTDTTADDEYGADAIATDGDDRISAFWQAARGHLGFGKMESIVGGNPLDVVPPPSFSYGEGAQADEVLAQILAGSKTESSYPRAEYGDELPRVGDVAIVLDGSGEPKALIRTTEVDDADPVVERFELVYPRTGPTPAVD